MMKYNICMIIETNSETRRINQSAIVDSFLIVARIVVRLIAMLLQKGFAENSIIMARKESALPLLLMTNIFGGIWDE